MGYFDLLRELADESRRLEEQAAQEAARVGSDADALVDAAWRYVGTPRLVSELYTRVAERNRHVALGLTRIRSLGSGHSQTLRVMAEEGLGPLEPYVAAMLGTSHRGRMLDLLVHTYAKTDRPIPRLKVLADGSDQPATVALRILARSCRADERRFVADRLAAGRVPQQLALDLRCALAEAGDESQDARLLIELMRAVQVMKAATAADVARGDARPVTGDENRQLARIIAAVSRRRLVSAVPMLTELLPSSACLHALPALAEIGDRSARPAIHAFASQLAGLSDTTLPLRVAVDFALNALGEEVAPEAAREVFATPRAGRDGYSGLGGMTLVQMMAATVLLDRGTEGDRCFVADLVGASDAFHRAIGARAWEQLHGEPPTVRLYDRARAGDLLQREGPEQLLDELRSPTAAYKGTIVEVLLEQNDTELRAETVRWCRKRLEGRPNPYVAGSEATGPDNQVLLEALAGLTEHERTQWLAETTSAWIRAFVLQSKNLERPKWETTIAPGVDVEISQLDFAPWVCGTHINGMAQSPDGSRLAVVGSQLGTIIDAASGEPIASLERRWSWGYDCAFTPDSSTVAVCYHGGHVETYDANSGRRLRELAGHNGVPHGVKRLAIAPDGTKLVTCGQDARVIAFDIDSGGELWRFEAPPGSYEAIAFTPDGKRIVASHVKTSDSEENFLSVFDAVTGMADRLDVEFPIWAIAVAPDGGQIALGGYADQIRLCDASFSELRRLELAKAVRVQFSDDGSTLYASSSSGVLKAFALAQMDYEGETLLEEGPLWAMATDESRGVVRAAGTTGIIHTVGGEQEATNAGLHIGPVRVLQQQDGLVYSAGSDGTLLRWSDGGGRGDAVFTVEAAINDFAVVSDGRAVLATGDGLHLIRLHDGHKVASREGRYGTLALSHDEKWVAVGVRHGIQLLDLDSLEPLGEPMATSTAGVAALAALEDGGWLVGSEDGLLSLIRGGLRVWTIADHRYARPERGDSNAAVCDILPLPGGRFVSSGSDNTVRVYQLDRDERPTQLKRIHTTCGPLNRLAVSPDGTLLASPSSVALMLFALPSASVRLMLPMCNQFESMRLTSAMFVGDEALVVATENGRLFRVLCKGLRS